MKKSITRVVALSLAIFLFLTVPGHAALERASDQIAYTTVALDVLENGHLSIYLSIGGVGKMNLIGATKVEVERFIGNSWECEFIFDLTNTPSLLVSQQVERELTLYLSPKMEKTLYRAIIYFYAEDNYGIDTYTQYTGTKRSH